MFDEEDLKYKPRERVYAVLENTGEIPTVKSPQYTSMSNAKPAYMPRKREVCVDCPHCSGTGNYVEHKELCVLDHGLCFQCQGKGWQGDRDRRFNMLYMNRREA